MPYRSRLPNSTLVSSIVVTSENSRRPDLLLAEASIAEAAANAGVERADLLPALALSDLVTLGDGSVDGLFSQAIASLSAVLGVPLIDGGRRRVEVRAAESFLTAELADYRQTLLSVLAEVETALTAISAAKDRTGEFQNAVTESEAAFEQCNALYREGLASLFDVLDVQRQLISSRESLIDGMFRLLNTDDLWQTCLNTRIR